MSADDPTDEAAELAEQILEEVSRPMQNWSNVAAMARELAAIAANAAARPSRGSDEP